MVFFSYLDILFCNFLFFNVLKNFLSDYSSSRIMQDYGICLDPTRGQATVMEPSKSQAWQKQERR